jgi:3-methyl-2-oxobutanoate hydroxymethyltransferase
MNPVRQSFLEKKAAGGRFSSLTAYDYVFGRMLDDLGLDFLLVGDSLGMVELGHPDTTGVTLTQMEHHVRAVAAGAKQTLLVADLPKGSYDSPVGAAETATRLVAAGARAVKIEGGTEVVPQVEAILALDIPVLGHLGMLPQRVVEEGGYKIKGKTPEQAAQLLMDAKALESSGVFGIVLELVTPPVAKDMTASLSVPTIGIGSGPDCDGQILVLYDLLGMFPWFRPRFVKPKADLATEIRRAVMEYRDEIQTA